jgi:hypothetical protein
VHVKAKLTIFPELSLQGDYHLSLLFLSTSRCLEERWWDGQTDMTYESLAMVYIHGSFKAVTSLRPLLHMTSYRTSLHFISDEAASFAVPCLYSLCFSCRPAINWLDVCPVRSERSTVHCTWRKATEFRGSLTY